MNARPDLNATFYRPIFKAFGLIILGFLMAPTEILLSTYQKYPAIKSFIIILGFVIVIGALINMIFVAIKSIDTQQSS
jgi:uncharacterized membrane protein